jgi:hypothetical protein
MCRKGDDFEGQEEWSEDYAALFHLIIAVYG